MKICDNNQCTGCGLCSIICPLGAITMLNDKYDFLHPVIDDEKCIKCGLCVRKCPSINIIEGCENNVAYAAYSKDESIHETSQSGGLAFLLEKHVLNCNGVVYGQAFNNQLEVSWIRIDDAKDLYKLQMSKYVQGRIDGSFKEVLNDLKKGNLVLFTGTPCQIAAILSFVPEKLKEKLLTISFVCGGVASPKNLYDQIEKLQEKNLINKSLIDNITFRKKGGGYYFRFFSNGKIIYEQDDFYSDFLIAYGEHLNLRESCYNCKYARTDRIGDLTIGDYLALDRYTTSLPRNELKKGVSLAIPTSEKGSYILQTILKDMEYEKRTTKDAALNNRRLSSPSERSLFVDTYRRLYPIYGFNKSVHKIFWKRYYWVGYTKHRIGTFIRRAIGK
ncbi:Coenzyme F420 hydrogenase/dehydrogenase, beta subunit C-terminal domain [Mordavella massiliensis]|uniref:Coenzyme F420 hydrogenase/dehydrogenase, beta subunit C-terminal domain n=1 Tax=Mordavella massiliensis TaxID=1871024 RepID=UPI00210B4EFF|nr:Coenzyme F420 hydrogenase/dehydrogenase, beta subunit C-terminal domain [Mordavella massiliensis]